MRTISNGRQRGVISKEAFIKHWRYRLAGMALFGIASDNNDGPLARAAKFYDIPQEVEKLLAGMYDDVCKEEPKPAANGAAQTKVGAK
jgi:hypothetical protein